MLHFCAFGHLWIVAYRCPFVAIPLSMTPDISPLQPIRSQTAWLAPWSKRWRHHAVESGNPWSILEWYFANVCDISWLSWWIIVGLPSIWWDHMVLDLAWFTMDVWIISSTNRKLQQHFAVVLLTGSERYHRDVISRCHQANRVKSNYEVRILGSSRRTWETTSPNMFQWFFGSGVLQWQMQDSSDMSELENLHPSFGTRGCHSCIYEGKQSHGTSVWSLQKHCCRVCREAKPFLPCDFALK